MNLASPATLLLAAAVTSPALYQAFVTNEMDPTTAMFRYLIAVPVCGIMVSMLSGLTNSYHQRQLEAREKARAAAQIVEDELEEDRQAA